MEETVLPNAEAQADAVAGEQPNPVDAPEKIEGEEAEKQEEQKPEKTPEQREIDRMRRKIDRLVRQREELRARVPNTQDLRQSTIDGTKLVEQDDSESVSLSRAELQRLVKEEAAKLAPTIKEQQAEIEHRSKVVQSLAKTWGQEKFDSLAAELDDSFGGLADASGKPKPATDAIFESDDPAALIEYLTDFDNADRAEAIGRMNGIRAGREIAKIEAEIAAKRAESKPQASKAPAPVEAIRGSGGKTNDKAPTDPKAYMKWANERYGRI